MTTYSYSLRLGDTQYIVVAAALDLLIEHCDKELACRPNQPPYPIWRETAGRLKESLDASAAQASGSYRDPESGEYRIWIGSKSPESTEKDGVQRLTTTIERHPMSVRLTKNEAIARLRSERPTLNISSSSTHFASINASKEVWWYDIPRSKIASGRHDALHLLAHDYRNNTVHHLAVPTKYLRDNLSKLVVRSDKDTISLELSASRSNFLQDVRPGGGRLHFAEFRQD